MTTRHLQHFSLSFRFRDPSNDAFAIPAGTDSAAPGADDLSRALHHLLALAPKLHTCTLWGPAVLSPSLFASPPPDDSPSPRWPALRSLTVQVGRTTPAGTWLYARDPSDADADADASASDRVSGRSDGGWNSPFSTDGALTPAFGDDGVDSDDSIWHETFHAYHALLASGQRPRRRFRTKVDGAALEPFVAAASRAVLRGMPRLERLLLHAGEGMEDGETELRSGRQVAWECYGGEEAGERRIVVETKPSFRGAHPKWRPSEELRRLWEEYAGEEGKVEVYLCEDYY